MIKNKIEIKDKILELRSNNKKIVFTNGCFDILHLGHATYLEESRNLGDFLVVAINSDESVRQLKGSGRPINSQSLRSKNLLNLDDALFESWHIMKRAGAQFIISYGARKSKELGIRE